MGLSLSWDDPQLPPPPHPLTAHVCGCYHSELALSGNKLSNFQTELKTSWPAATTGKEIQLYSSPSVRETWLSHQDNISALLREGRVMSPHSSTPLYWEEWEQCLDNLLPVTIFIVINILVVMSAISIWMKVNYWGKWFSKSFNLNLPASVWTGLRGFSTKLS